MSQSQDAYAASGSVSAPKRSIPVTDHDDEDLENMLGCAVEEAVKKVDVVGKYHEMMRRTLVDWGDELLDLVAARFAESPKTVAQIEAVRAETIDPLRPSRAV